MQVIIDFVKGIEPRGRLMYFFQTFIVGCFVVLLKKVTGNHAGVSLLINIASMPFLFVVARGRILDIEKGIRRKTLLTETWCIVATITVLVEHHISKKVKIIKVSPRGEFWVGNKSPYNTGATGSGDIFLILLSIGLIAFSMYILFKRGHKAITAEKESQDRIAEQASWDDNWKKQKPTEPEQ